MNRKLNQDELQDRIDKQYAATVPAGYTTFNVGDLVEVIDEGLARLRQICPGMPPNHHGTVREVMISGRLLIQFDGSDQVAPYPTSKLKRRVG